MTPISRHDSFSELRAETRWRVAVLMCSVGLTAMVALGIANWLGGRADSVNLAIGVFVILAACMAALLTVSHDLSGRIYFWLSVAILVFLPYFGYIHGRSFHYWMYVLPPTLFFLMPARWALVAMLLFGAYACALLTPFTAGVDIARIGLSYLLLVTFMFAYAWLEERAGAMLRYYSAHDPLTNAYNRRTFNERLDELAGARGATTTGVLLIDIDHFKAINDAHGHLIGDRVITSVAAVLTQQLPAEAMLFRYGGEEFAVLWSLPNADDLSRLAEQLRAAVANGAHGIPVTVSIGAARWQPGSNALPAVIAAADQALYAAKRNGRNRAELA